MSDTRNSRPGAVRDGVGREVKPVAVENPSQAGDEVAVTGSPNSVNEVSFDVREIHQSSALLGTLCSLRVPVRSPDGTKEPVLVLGQVARIETTNRWHEDSALKNFIKLRGKLPHLTEVGDVTTGTLSIIGAYRTKKDGRYEKTRLPVPPGSGLRIVQVDAGTVSSVMEGDFGYAYLGTFYGSRDVPAPVYVRHFGDFEQRGSGEAYMGGVFGPSGSGKSVIAASLIALWAQHPGMGLLILDPAAEFSQNAFGRGSALKFDFHEILQRTSGGRFRPDRDVVQLDQLQLEGSEMFVQILSEKGFFKALGVGAVKIPDAVEAVGRLLDGLSDQSVWDTSRTWAQSNTVTWTDASGSAKSLPDCFCAEAAVGYVQSNRAAKAQEFRQAWIDRATDLERTWNETASFFCAKDEEGNPRHKALQLIESCVLKGRIAILNLNPRLVGMEEPFKLYLMDFVFRKLRQVSHRQYSSGKAGNCLIVLDEAGRFIPESAGDNDRLRQVAQRLTDSVAEMRKMRCGFLFITQTIAEIRKQIFRNLHFRIYGVGLGVGADEEHIKDKEGPEAFDLYKALPDPRLSGSYAFMVAGVLLALGSSGKPMFIEGFASGEDLVTANLELLGQPPAPQGAYPDHRAVARRVADSGPEELDQESTEFDDLFEPVDDEVWPGEEPPDFPEPSGDGPTW